MRSAFAAIRKFAQTEAPVLILGESGTGKELAARAVHERSAAKDGPFVAVNCAGLPESLIASELFGYEKGAFTGANARKTGKIEAANGGTLFLDEIGDMPWDLQPLLLRFLQEKTVDRVGGTRPVPVDVRVIAATNQNIQKLVREGRFREDLYFRLNVLNLELPALRDRGDDVELLALFFVRKFAREIDRDGITLSACARRAVKAYDWPGNVREMISKLRRAVILTEGDIITAKHLEFDSDNLQPDLSLSAEGPRLEDVPLPRSLAAARAAVERVQLERALSRHPHNLSAAARELEVSRVTLYKLLERHRLSSDDM